MMKYPYEGMRITHEGVTFEAHVDVAAHLDMKARCMSCEIANQFFCLRGPGRVCMDTKCSQETFNYIYLEIKDDNESGRE